MSLNDTVSAERTHIGFFGMRNVGKSSVVNAVTGQELSIVSDVKGTTTDPVKKAMEILPIGPVLIIDTPGLDDEGSLGEMRVKKTRDILKRTDIAVLVANAQTGLCNEDRELIEIFKENKIPYLLVFNKSDLVSEHKPPRENEIYVSALKNENIYELKEKLASFAKSAANNKTILGDLINENDLIVLVVPVDEAAPKGRLILPQQQTIREILDFHSTAVVCQDTELEKTLASLSRRPKMVITDSQAFGRVSKIVPDNIWLTSFSILFARYKGSLKVLTEGAAVIKDLKDGDRVLVSEGCTHHRQCGDIGSVKIPAWIKKFTGAEPQFEFSSGNTFSDDLKKYKLVIHCGGCTLNEREMKSRIGAARVAGVPIVNYGIAIAYMHGILHRALEPFPEILKIIEDVTKE